MPNLRAFITVCPCRLCSKQQLFLWTHISRDCLKDVPQKNTVIFFFACYFPRWQNAVMIVMMEVSSCNYAFITLNNIPSIINMVGNNKVCYQEINHYLTPSHELFFIVQMRTHTHTHKHRAPFLKRVIEKNSTSFGCD